MGMHENLKDLSNVSKLRNEKREEWLKQVVLGATTLVGVLISLHKEKSPTEATHVLFCLTIGLLALGILSGAMVLFAPVNAYHRYLTARWKVLKKDLDASGGLYNVANPLRIFDLARIICYLSLILAMPVLVFYAVLIDK